MTTMFLSSFCLIWCYIFGSFVAKTTAVEQQSKERFAFKNPNAASYLKRSFKEPSCVISDIESDGLTKLLNGFVNVFSDKSRPVRTLYDSSSPFEPNCETGIAQLENSVWFILNRVWLATSCQYSDQELDNAIEDVENEGRKMLVTLKDVTERNTPQILVFNDSATAKVRETLEEAVTKMRRGQESGCCHSSSLKVLTSRFESALREFDFQKQAVASLHQETKQAIKSEKEEILKVLQDIVLRLEETKKAIGAITPQKSERLNATLLSLEFSRNETSTDSSSLNAEKTINQADSKLLSHGVVATISELNSTMAPTAEGNSNLAPSSALQSYLSSGFAGLHATGRFVNLENVDYRGEYLYLLRNPIDRNVSPGEDSATSSPGYEKLNSSAWQWEFVPAPKESSYMLTINNVPKETSTIFYLLNKLNKHKPIPSTQDDYGQYSYIKMEIVSSPGGDLSNQLVIYMKARNFNKYYYCPTSPPHNDWELPGRDIGWSSSRESPGTKWIVTYVS